MQKYQDFTQNGYSNMKNHERKPIVSHTWKMEPQMSMDDIEKIKITDYITTDGVTITCKYDRKTLINSITISTAAIIARQERCEEKLISSELDRFTKGLQLLNSYITDNMDIFLNRELATLIKSRTSLGEKDYGIKISLPEIQNTALINLFKSIH